jgi:hypothetical protein
VIGFSDKLRFMVLTLDDIRPCHEFSIRGCRESRFSNDGHLFAAANGNTIQVYSSVSFENVYNLKGHNGTVRGNTDTPTLSHYNDWTRSRRGRYISLCHHVYIGFGPK